MREAERYKGKILFKIPPYYMRFQKIKGGRGVNHSRTRTVERKWPKFK